MAENSVMLKGMRYGMPIEKECEDVEEAISEAVCWLPNYNDGQTIGWAAPIQIEDKEGNVLVSEKDLRARLSDRY